MTKDEYINSTAVYISSILAAMQIPQSIDSGNKLREITIQAVEILTKYKIISLKKLIENSKFSFDLPQDLTTLEKYIKTAKTSKCILDYILEISQDNYKAPLKSKGTEWMHEINEFNTLILEHKNIVKYISKFNNF